MEQLTTLLRLRITPALDKAIRGEAQRLRLRPADVARVALDVGLADPTILADVVRRARPVGGGGGDGGNVGAGDG